MKCVNSFLVAWRSSAKIEKKDEGCIGYWVMLEASDI